MAEQVRPPDTTPATTVDRVSAEEYMAAYAHDFYEWVDGVLIKMPPVSLQHNLLTGYLRRLVETYFDLRPTGTVVGAPFVMRIDATESRREPDLQIILDTNDGELTDTAMVGPADIVIEVVSAESVARDHGEKLEEYETGSVPEYWIIDPLREQALFYRLDEGGIFRPVELDDDGNYQTPALPGLRLHVLTLWEDALPGNRAVMQMVEAMLEQAETDG